MNGATHGMEVNVSAPVLYMAMELRCEYSTKRQWRFNSAHRTQI
jgi:hypothetical protein